jgi:hypothetical protein
MGFEGLSCLRGKQDIQREVIVDQRIAQVFEEVPAAEFHRILCPFDAAVCTLDGKIFCVHFLKIYFFVQLTVQSKASKSG